MNLKKHFPWPLVLVAITLAGCGAGVSSVSAGNPPGHSTNGTIVTQAGPVNIDLKSPTGQKELDQKVDQKLKSLDQALDSLDKSLGKIQ